MEKLTNSIDKVVIEMTVRNMLNPNNKDFYIPNITIEKLQRLVDGDEYAAHIFFSAFTIASAKYAELVEYCEMQDYLDELKSFKNSKLYQDRFACPECGCSSSQGFVPGCRCPNCDNISVIDLSDIF